MIVIGVFNAWDDPKIGLLEASLEGISIFFAIFFITSIAAGNDYIKEKQFISLEDQAKDYDVSCIRGQNGTTAPINAWELVVGDIITFEAGDRIPADCLLLSSVDLKVDEAYHNDDEKTILPKRESNEESFLNESNFDSFLLAESLVVEGSGKAVVLVVCDPYCTRHRRTIRQDADDAEVSPLQQRLSNIGDRIGQFGIYTAVLVFLTFLVRSLITLMATNIDLMSKETIEGLLGFVTTCITLVMVAVPEGLPLAVSLSVAYSLDKMKKQKLLIKNADSQERMGGVDTIITGKTGTLTQANMRVTHFRIAGAGESHQNSSAGYFNTCEIDEEIKEKIRQSILFNCTAKVEMSEDARYVPTGNGTEVGLLKFLQNNGEPVQDSIKKKVGNVLAYVPWTPARKMETTVVRLEDGTVRVFSKGAPEELFKKCNMDEGERAQILDETVDKEFGMNGLRPFAFAFKDMSEDDFNALSEENNKFESPADRVAIESDLEYLAVFALIDDLRSNGKNKTVADDIKFATKGGINVIMVSGDNLFTARSAAIKAGIVSESRAGKPEVCITGKEFRDSVGGYKFITQPNGSTKVEFENAAEFGKVAANVKVLARALPEDKLALVCGLQSNGFAVAATGEGLNDATTLKQADVGFAMGSGCELAKDHADMVILDDNFGSSMVAVSWGRNIYDNIRKFIQFQMTVNISCCVLVAFTALMYGRSVFSVIHLLWINMIMDTFAALALATEPPNSEDLTSKPVKETQPILNEIMWRQILSQNAW